MDQQQDIDSSSVIGVSNKSPILRQLLQITLASFSLILLFYSASGLYRKLVEYRLAGNETTRQAPKQILGIETQKIVRAVPTRLKIPSINIDASIEQVGINSDGEMDVPGDSNVAGWYRLGSSPGEQGSAVIAGHFNGKTGQPGIFNNLEKLKPGDKIIVSSDSGIDTSFLVRESRTYRPGYVEEVFSSRDSGIHLNLITCDGAWDESKESYSKRLVIFADILN